MKIKRTWNKRNKTQLSIWQFKLYDKPILKIKVYLLIAGDINLLIIYELIY